MKAKTFRHIYSILLLQLFAISAFSQTYYPLNVTSGTQIIGGVAVTVTPFGNATAQTICGVAPYCTFVGGYKYSFTGHISHVRSHIMNINTGDEMLIKFNGSQYSVTNSNLSPYSGSCGNVSNSVVPAANGDIVGTTLDTTGVQFDAAPATYIDSAEFNEIYAFGAGAIFDLSFVPVCTIIPVISADTPCLGGTLHLSTSGFIGTLTSFSWTGPNGFTSSAQNPSIPNLTSAGIGTYYLVAQIDTCNFHVAINVVAKPLPATPVISANQTSICTGDALLLSANSSNATSYSWTGPASFSSTNQSTTVSNFTPSNAGYYHATAYLNGCSSTDSLQITLKPKPVKPTSSNNGPLCAGSNLSLSGSSSTPGVSYSWTGPNGFSTTTQNPGINNVPLADSGNYVVTALLNGCGSSDTTHVVIKPLPASLSASSNSPVCAGDTLKLFSGSSSTGVSYQWAGPSSYSSFNQNPIILAAGATSAGSYYLTATLNTCSLIDTIAVSVNPVPALPSISGNGQVCNSRSLNLGATSSTSGVTYIWTGPNSFYVTSQNMQINPVSMSDSGYYTITTTLNGCKSIDSIKVSVKPLPASVTAASNSPVCQNSILNLTSGSSSTGVSFTWSGPASYTSTQQNPSIPNVALSASGLYKMVASLNGCTDTVNVPVIIEPTVAPPGIVISANPGDTVCLGQNVLFVAVPSNGGNPAYQWMKNGSNISGATANFYSSSSLITGDHISCNITGTLSCQPVNTSVSNILTMLVQSFPAPGVTLTAYPTIYVPGNSVTFTGHLTGNTTGLLFNWLKNGVIIPGATGSFYTTNNLSAGDSICLLVHSSVLCTIPDSVLACYQIVTTGIGQVSADNNIRIYPNPTSDKLNIEYVRMTGTSSSFVKIFNMIGQLVYEEEWSGSTKAINTNAFVPGSYILEVSKPDGSRSVYKIEKY